MLFPLLSKKWLIFAKSYYYRSMCYPMYVRSGTQYEEEENDYVLCDHWWALGKVVGV